MLLRRIRKHVETENWFAVAIDFVIVVVGVYIGIQLGNWNAEQQSRAADRVYLSRIAQDIESDAIRLQQSIENWDVEIEEIARLERFFVGDDALGENAGEDALGDSASGETLWDELVDVYISSGWSPFVLDTTTYDELVASGRFSRVGDPNLREAIIGYYNMMRESVPFYQYNPGLRERVRDTFDVKTTTWLWKECFSEEAYRELRNGQVACAPPPDGYPLARIANALRADPEILEQLRVTHSIRMVAYITAEEDLKQAKALAARLRDFET